MARRLRLHRVRRAARARSSRAPSRCAPRTAGYEVIEEGQMLENAARIAAEAVEHASAPPVTAGLKDLDPDAVARDAHDPRDHRAPDRARSRHGLRGQLRRHQLHQARRRRQVEIRLEAVQRHRRSHHPRRHVHRRLRRRRREDAGVAAGARGRAGRPADQPRDRALHGREGVARLHLRHLVAQLSVPAHAQRPRRRRSGRARRRPRRSSPTRRTASSSTAAAATRSISSATTASSAATRSGK